MISKVLLVFSPKKYLPDYSRGSAIAEGSSENGSGNVFNALSTLSQNRVRDTEQRVLWAVTNRVRPFWSYAPFPGALSRCRFFRWLSIRTNQKYLYQESVKETRIKITRIRHQKLCAFLKPEVAVNHSLSESRL